MKKLIVITGLMLALCLSSFVQAGELTLNTTLNGYQGNGAYLAIYLTDAKGKYHRTLWVAGSKRKYYKHLPDWARGSSLKISEYDGMTGASVTSGESLTVTVNIDDTLIDAGYLIRIDSAVEDQREHRIDVEVPLTRQGAGKAVVGRGYIKNFSYSL